MTGVYGGLIIEGDSDPVRADRDYSVLLSDWTDGDPMRVLSKLKVRSDYYNYNQPTVLDFFRDISHDGLKAALDKRKMWNQMRMNPTDLADLSGATLTYLMNGVTPAGNWTGLFRPGERCGSASSMVRAIPSTMCAFRDSSLRWSVDGQNIEPVTIDEFRFGHGETCDVLVEPTDEAHTIFAQSMDRTGFARGTLAAREGFRRRCPRRTVEWLAMADMMGSMGHGGMDHGMMAGMDHGAMNHGALPMEHSQHGGMAMDHSQHTISGRQGMEVADPLKVPSTKARHARTEYGASTDMRVDMARTNLDDPGIGLRNNGRRVLTLSDQHTIGGAMDARGPARWSCT